ncbi:Bifunctional NAD(P)H-hydrate repair enzyme Nnr [Rosistilla carotiformis]|uniref:NAD(P)H-hydrate epimerase n=1 Tax=Rosistilla carotiformis TaxID=2528017 RepID=A0A518JZ34_9BACT|nr:NAD(P)H-hydrate epimerase [Rosistilla carotiformis]QDV70802.1 Bifunctional NAD(P)H-hydrate repair enzyme Nnr [Rosistilla carotiformis]
MVLGSTGTHVGDQVTAAALRPLTRAEVRSIDEIAIGEYGMPGICLMENAGRGAAEQIVAHTPANEIAILCGGGNNGGDGFVIARHLELMGRRPHVFLLADPGKLAGDALTNWQIAMAGKIACEVVDERSLPSLQRKLADAACIVDAMLGTGASGDPRGAIALAIQAANAAKAFRVAIDLPSGLDCDTGSPGNPCFRADLTCTFVAEKIGFDAAGAREFTGTIRVVPIGAPADLMNRYAASESNGG